MENLAALRFEGHAKEESSITNCAIHNGLFHGIYIFNSKNVLIQNNIVYKMQLIGINLGGVSDITVDRNIVGHIKVGTVPLLKYGGILSCTYFSEG